MNRRGFLNAILASPLLKWLPRREQEFKSGAAIKAAYDTGMPTDTIGFWQIETISKEEFLRRYPPKYPQEDIDAFNEACVDFNYLSDRWTAAEIADRAQHGLPIMR